MSVRLKFKVQQKSEFMTSEYKDGQTVPVRCGKAELTPVMDGSEENKQFYRFTPSGRIEFATINAEALDSLPLGGECYVTIEPVAAAQ